MPLKHPKSLKKRKETISASSMTEECDVFNDALDNDDCRGILLNCLINLEKEVKTIRSLVDQNRQTQIKGKQSFAIFQSQSYLSLINKEHEGKK